MRFLLLAYLLGSSTGLMFAIVDAPGVWPAAIAMLIAGLLLAITSVAVGIPGLADALRVRRTWLVALVVGLATVALASAVSYTSVAIVAFVTQLVPVVVVLLAPLFRETITLDDAAAITLAVAVAIVLAFDDNGSESRSHLVGIALAFAGALGGGLVLHLQRAQALRAMPPVPTQAVVLTLGGLLLLPAAGRPPALSTVDVLLVATIACVFAVANALHLRALRDVTATRAAAARPLHAVFAAALGAIVLGQHPSVFTTVGGLLAVAAGMLVIFRPIARTNRRAGRLLPADPLE